MVEHLEAKIYSNDADIAAISTKINEIDAAIALLEEKCASYATKAELKAEVEAMQDNVIALLTSYVDDMVEHLEAKIYSNDADIAAISTKIN